MPGSSGPCTLEHFYKITEHLLLSDVKAACKSKKDHGGGTFLPETWNTGKLCIGLKGDCPHMIRAGLWLCIINCNPQVKLMAVTSLEVPSLLYYNATAMIMMTIPL